MHVPPCAFCSTDLDRQTVEERQAHYEQHFREEEHTSTTSEPVQFSGGDATTFPLASTSTNANKPVLLGTTVNSPKTSSSRKKKWNPVRFYIVPETDDFWYPGMLKYPPSNYTPGIIPILEYCLLKSHLQGSTRRAVLCHAGATHVAKQLWDSGWGCGYRNFLVACAALMQQETQQDYRSILELGPFPPSIRNLQSCLETAWSDGFDPEAAADIGRLHETRKWIGTSDLWIAFTYLGIPSTLVDFDLKNQTAGIKLLTDWVINYFGAPTSNATNINQALFGVQSVTITDKMPIIFQRKGHSQSIVGYEIDRSGEVNLLIFDSSKKVDAKLRQTALERYLHTMTNESIPPLSEQPSHQFEAGSSESGHLEGSPRRGVIASLGTPSLLANTMKSANMPMNRDIRPDVVLKQFRVRPKQIQKFSQYQLLYFPLTATLTTNEKLQRKRLFSTLIC